MDLEDSKPARSITWLAARYSAGIRLGHTVGPLGITAETLARVERGELLPTEELRRRAMALYGLPPGTVLVAGSDSRGVSRKADHFFNPIGPPEDLPATVAYQPIELIEARKTRKLTLQEAGQQIGVAASTLYKIEKGDSSVSGHNALRVLRFYGIEPERTPTDMTQAPEGVVILRVRKPTLPDRRAKGDPSGTKSGSPEDGTTPQLPAGPIELVACPAPSYLIGRTPRDRDALRAMGGELMQAEDASLWPDIVVRSDLDPIDLNPTIRDPNGLNEEYRSRLVAELLEGQAIRETGQELARLVWGMGMDYQTASERAGLSQTTGREYFFKMKKWMKKLWEREDIQRRAVELFGEIYGVEIGAN